MPGQKDEPRQPQIVVEVLGLGAVDARRRERRSGVAVRETAGAEIQRVFDRRLAIGVVQRRVIGENELFGVGGAGEDVDAAEGEVVVGALVVEAELKLLGERRAAPQRRLVARAELHAVADLAEIGPEIGHLRHIGSEQGDDVSPGQRREIADRVAEEARIVGEAGAAVARPPQIGTGDELIGELLVEPEGVAPVDADAVAVAAGDGHAGVVHRRIDPHRKPLVDLERDVRGADLVTALQHDVDGAERIAVQHIETGRQHAEIDRAAARHAELAGEQARSEPKRSWPTQPACPARSHRSRHCSRPWPTWTIGRRAHHH